MGPRRMVSPFQSKVIPSGLDPSTSYMVRKMGSWLGDSFTTCRSHTAVASGARSTAVRDEMGTNENVSRWLVLSSPGHLVIPVTVRNMGVPNTGSLPTLTVTESPGSGSLSVYDTVDAMS